METTNDDLETMAREEIVAIAKENELYFVVWYSSCGNYFVAIENKSKKDPNVYAAMHEMYFSVVNDDPEKFRFSIPEKFTWANVLSLVKANMPVNYIRKEIACF